MDDLYGNAWGDPVNDYSSNSTYPLPTWNARPPSPEPSSPVEDVQNDNNVNDDEHEDLTTKPQFPTDAPDTSWTTEAVPWPVEESRNQHYSAWAPTSPANVWSSTTQPQSPTVLTPAPSDGIPPVSPPPASLPEGPMKEPPIPLELPQGTPVQSRAPSPDQFGIFESGNLDTTIPVEEGGWGSPKYSTFDDSVDSSDAWGQQATTKELDTEAEPVDEWEAARLAKEMLDRRVPPEVVASIIETFEQFSEKMWPEGSSSNSRPPEEWLQSWRRGFDSVEGLNNLVDTLLPEYTFAPRVPFTKSAVAKEMTKSLRLTRHSAITRLSPMAHFMRNKGSSSDWETAVKNRSDEIPDDMPVGWRIVEKKEEAPAVETKKRSGLFSSLWNRRKGSTTSLPSIQDVKTSLVRDSPTESSPTKPASFTERIGTPPIVPPRTASQSPRQSVEGRRSQSMSSNRLPKPPPVAPVVTASVSASSENTVSSIGQSPADAMTSPIELTATADGPAQSTVSRFLNRFSRPKSAASHNSSLSLSSEDLDFLSDAPVVHSVNGVGDRDDDVPLGKQKALMESQQGAVLATPLTATPTRASASNRQPPQTVAEDDFDALFNTPIVQPRGTPLQTPSRPSSVSQRGPFLPPSTTPQTDFSRAQTNLLRPQTPSFPVVRMSSTSSTSSSGAIPFLIPPPPSSASRPSTPPPPVGILSPPITTSIPVLHPPHSTQKPTETKLFDDDNEFSDFLSSSQQQLAANGNRQSKTLSLAGPIKSIGSLDSITPSTSQQPILQRTSFSSSLVSPVSDAADDAWGFDDFEDSAPAASTTTNSNHVPSMVGTPPMKSTLSPLSASQKWLSKPSPPPPPVPSKSGSSTPSSLTNSPIGPPPKSQFASKQRPPPFNILGPDQQESPRSRSHSRRVSAEDHSHTIQLMNGASRRGAWPAPLSPLPEALSPPPPPSSTINRSMTAANTSKALLDVGAEGGPFSRAQEKLRPPKATVSVIGPSGDGGGMNFSNVGFRGSGGLFSLPPPPGSVPRPNPTPPQPEREQSLLDFGDFESPKTASRPKPTLLTADDSGGGLSAQDLSFFEGL